MKNNQEITIESYNKTVDAFIQKTDSLHPAKEAKKFLSFLKPNALILDLGCGPGRDAKIFAALGFHVIGVDLSEKMIETAAKRVPKAKFKIMDLKELDFPNNYFDGIWASASYLHIPKTDLPNALKEAHRVLKKNGIFYASVKEGKEGQGEHIAPDKRYGDVKKFWSFFEKKYIEKAVADTGFSLIESYTQDSEWPEAKYGWIKLFAKK